VGVGDVLGVQYKKGCLWDYLKVTLLSGKTELLMGLPKYDGGEFNSVLDTAYENFRLASNLLGDLNGWFARSRKYNQFSLGISM